MIATRLKLYSSSIKAATASALATACSLVIAIFPMYVVTATSFFLSLFIIRRLDDIFDAFLDKYEPVRSFIFGKENIEGFWVDVLYSETGAIKEFGIIRISFRQRQFNVHGDLYSDRVERIGEFWSKMTSFKGQELIFVYERELHQAGIQKATGLSRYVFREAADKRFPQTFNGEFFDDHLDEKIRIEGNRVIGKEDEEILRDGVFLKNPETVIRIVKKYAPFAAKKL